MAVVPEVRAGRTATVRYADAAGVADAVDAAAAAGADAVAGYLQTTDL